MGNDVFNYVTLTGCEKQIDHFINNNIRLVGYGCNEDDDDDDDDDDHKMKIWDCEPFLIEKKCDDIEFLKRNESRSLFSSCGRFKEGKDKNGDRYIVIEGKYALCDSAIKLVSKYYDNLTIVLDYQDEDYEMGYGWCVIRNGTVLGEDYVSVSNLMETYSWYFDNPNVISNSLVVTGEKETVDKFILQFDKTNLKECKLIDNVLEFITQDEPFNLIKELSENNPELSFELTYKGYINLKFYGYIVAYGGAVIVDQFINLDSEYEYGDGINYLEYKNFSDFKNKTMDEK